MGSNFKDHMELTGIIAISGKPGLYRVIAQGKNSIIVESLEDKRRIPAYSSDRISALEDISIYTYSEDKPLKEIYSDIYKKENGGATISHKEDAKKLQAYLLEVLPDFDQERVYGSDIKKLFQWYNLLHKADLLKPAEEEKKPAKKAAEKTTEASEEKPKTAKAKDGEKEPATKKAPAKKPAVAKKAVEKVATPKASSKTTAAKKVVAPKTGGGRGK